MLRKIRQLGVRKLIGMALLLAILSGVWYVLDTIWVGLGHGIVKFLVYAHLPLALAALAVAASVAAVHLFDRRWDALDRAWDASWDNSPTERSKAEGEAKRYRPWLVGAVCAAIGGTLATIASIVALGYSINNTYTVATPTTTDNAAQASYDERVPFEVAETVSSRNLGNTIGDGTGILRANPDTRQYSTAIVRRGVGVGYESVQVINTPLYGTSDPSEDVQFCDFDQQAAPWRINGALWSNALAYRALHTIPGWNPTSSFEDSDVVYDCDGDTPMVYIPVTTLNMTFWSAYRVPAGVVVYNGSTGELTYHEEFTSDKGLSVYPISVAKQQRESVNTRDGFWSWLMERSGYGTTGKSGQQSNVDNPTEFTLHSNSGNVYVTPLTPRGSSLSVVGLMEVPSTTVKAGEFASPTIRLYDEVRKSPDTVASSITAGVLAGYKKGNQEIFEVVPSENGNWTATIGTSQNVRYRAVITPDGAITLFDSPSGNVAARSVDGLVVDPLGDDNDTNGESHSDGGPVDVSNMSADEISALIQEALDELTSRTDN